MVSAALGESIWRRTWIVPLLIVVMLGAMALSQVVGRFAETVGVDFYNFWGVPTALRLSGGTVGSPYRDGARYQAVLKEYGTTVAQPRLKAAQRFWSGADYTGSPLLYRLFALVSDDYTRSLLVFRTLQVLAFVSACGLLGWLYRIEAFHGICFTLIALLFYQPVLSDLRVANLGCLQFGALAALLGVTVALPRARAALAAALGAGLAALALCKPNVAPVAAFLAVHLAVRHGVWTFAASALAAAGVGAVLVALSCLYFGSWTVWLDWYRFVYGANSRMLVRPVEAGNYSTPLLASSWLGVDLSAIAGALLALLVASLVVVRWPVAGWRPRAALAATVSTFGRLFGDPHAAVAAALGLTMAASPLAWVHYYVLLLIPSLWLLGSGAVSPAVPVLAALGVVMSGGILGLALWGLGWPGAMPATIALSWLPLWAALLIDLRWSDGAAAVAGQAVPDARPRRPRRGPPR